MRSSSLWTIRRRDSSSRDIHAPARSVTTLWRWMTGSDRQPPALPKLPNFLGEEKNIVPIPPGTFRARTLAPCYSADLRPATGSLVSAVGCTVLLTAPALRGSGAVSWEYRAGSEERVILSYAFHHPPNVSLLYKNRTTFNESSLSLQVVLQRGDGRLYRLRAQEEATAWFHLHVVEPLSQPKIVGNSLVKAGGNTKLVCNVVEGKADAYWWKRNGELLLRSERIEFVENTTLCILQASLSDSGYYTCVVSNAVSQNETSFLLQVHHSANVMLPVVLTCVIIGLLAAGCPQSKEVVLSSVDDDGVLVWWQKRENLCDNCW
ncbi:transmembrane and immunoglobulin domain-containing protein 1-like [Chamaea fasciata]|uniref:transmembrane and immunoglobulin domain-containing protein 1-like n=1 Tax=Chamaea fasciata TaxID=190680 RepID=UPI00336A27A9